MILPVQATVKGRFRWEVLDEQGRPEQAVTPSGAPIHGTGVWHDNLITNRGMDQIAAEGFRAFAPASFSLRRYMAIGEGSATPAFTDTTLAAEVQRSQSDGGLSQGNAYTYDSGNGVFRQTTTNRRVITMNANRNLTEYGLDPETGAGVSIRELLRDGVGDPITVALLSGKSLRLDHQIIYEVPDTAPNGSFDLEEYDAGDNLVSTTPINYTMAIGVEAGQEDFLFTNILAPDNDSGTGRITSPGTVSPTTGFSGGVSDGKNAAFETYVNGNYYQDKVSTFSAAEANGDWYGYFSGYVSNPSRYGAIFVQFTSPATITKANTHTLKLGIRLSWARA